MKYIRTKDGRIIELPKQPTLLKYENTILDLNEIRKGKVGHEIINALIDKQADNIEDLCDKFVWFNAPHYYEIYDDFEDIEDCYHAENVSAIYGAIWTDKGLIFVAKLKERKMELLWLATL